MTVNTSGGFVEQAHAPPAYPCWFRFALRVESYGDVFPWGLAKGSGGGSEAGWRLFLASNGVMYLGNVTSSGANYRQLDFNIAPFEGSNVVPILIELLSASSARVSVPSTTGALLDMSFTNLSELAAINKLSIGGCPVANGSITPGGAFSLAEHAEGTGTLDAPLRAALLNVANRVEEIPGLTGVNVVPMNPPGVAGADVPDSLPSVTGGAALATSATVVVSSRAHPVARGTPAGLTGNATLDGPTAAGGLTSVAPSTLSGAATLDGPAAAGTLGVAPGILTSLALRRNNGTIAAGVALDWLTILVDGTGAFVATKTGIATNGSGVFTTSDAGMAPGTVYRAVWREAGGQRGHGWAAAT